MLTELCQELRNWFDLNRYTGTFTISDGALTADFLLSGQYYRIIGSIFNDGVHQQGNNDLMDETFTGAVWALAIPAAVVQLAEKIEQWQTKYGAVDSAAMSPYTSESFGGYTYSKGTNAMSATGSNTATGWKSVFSSDLNRWRKI